MLEEDLNKIYSKLPKMDSKKCFQKRESGECKNECCTITGCSKREKHLVNRHIERNNLDLPFIRMNVGWGYILPNSLGSGTLSREEITRTKVKCSYLKNGECAIYDIRPAICRLFGACKQMPCSYFPEEAKVDMPPIKMVKELGMGLGKT